MHLNLQLHIALEAVLVHPTKRQPTSQKVLMPNSKGTLPDTLLSLLGASNGDLTFMLDLPPDSAKTFTHAIPESRYRLNGNRAPERLRL